MISWGSFDILINNANQSIHFVNNNDSAENRAFNEEMVSRLATFVNMNKTYSASTNFLNFLDFINPFNAYNATSDKTVINNFGLQTSKLNDYKYSFSNFKVVRPDKSLNIFRYGIVPLEESKIIPNWSTILVWFVYIGLLQYGIYFNFRRKDFN